MLEYAGRLGLTGPLGINYGSSSGEGAALVRDLMESLHRRGSQQWDLPRIWTALTWFDGFLQATEREPFVAAIPPDELAGFIWNRMTLDLFGEYIRRSPPLAATRGEHVSGEAISSYKGCIRLLRSREARYDIAPDDVNLNMPLALKGMRREDGPPGDRRLSRGLRAAHLRDAAAAGFDRSSTQGKVEWAGELTGHNLALRGGEMGVPDNAAPDPQRIITWKKIAWRPPRVESANRPWVTVSVVGIKDVSARKKGRPLPIGRRHDGPFGADPLCTYDAIAAAWWARRAPPGTPFPCDDLGRPAADWWQRCPRHAGAPGDDEAFFSHTDGTVFTTSTVRALNRRVAMLAGISPDDVGAKALRIGGATDWREQLGDAGKDIIRRRGRWESDVAEVYQRPLVAPELAASMQLASACGADLEALCDGWAQAATR